MRRLGGNDGIWTRPLWFAVGSMIVYVIGTSQLSVGFHKRYYYIISATTYIFLQVEISALSI
jgi:hypothetical protein